MITNYVFFLCLSLLFLLSLLMIPYHEMLHTVGVITKEENKYFVTVNIPKRYIADIGGSKIVIKDEKYKVDVQKITYDKINKTYLYLLKIDSKKNIEIKSIPEEMIFELDLTTLLKQITIKMKGWFS